MNYRFREILVFLLLTFCIPWIFTLLIILFRFNSGMIYYTFVGCAAIAPSSGALISIFIFRGKDRFFETIRNMFTFRFNPYLYLIMFCLVITSYYLGTAIAYILGFVAPTLWISTPRKISTSVVSPFGEEFGWRGLLTPYMIEKFSPVIASLTIGLVWGVWHIWYFVIPGAFHYSTPLWLLIIDCCGGSLWYTWFYKKSRSIVIAILFHFAGNLFYNIIPCGPSWFNGNIVPNLISSMIVLISGLIAVIFFKGPTSCRPLNLEARDFT